MTDPKTLKNFIQGILLVTNREEGNNCLGPFDFRNTPFDFRSLIKKLCL